MDRIEAMSAFVAVAELKGFSAAARRLGLSTSSVTRLIAGLEEGLGIRLLARTTRQVALTDTGARYLENARRILTAIDEAERAARAEKSAPAGRFVVAAPSLFGRREVAPLMCDFLARYPAVLGELLLSDRLSNLVEEGIDVAVRIGALDDSSLRSRVVGRTRRVVVASPKYLAGHKRIRTPRELGGHSLIYFSALGPTPEWRFVRDGKEQRLPIKPSFITNSADAAIEHAERGGGLTMVLAYQVVESVRRRKLQVVLQRYELPPLPIQLVFPTARLPAASLKAFIELVVATRKWSFVDLDAGEARTSA
jgi:DNA-binding transcriptional LysR family regulator